MNNEITFFFAPEDILVDRNLQKLLYIYFSCIRVNFFSQL